MRFLTLVYLFFSLLFIASCSYKQDQILFEQRSSIDTLEKNNTEVINNYKIKPQDILQIRNLQNMKYIVDDAPAEGNTPGSASGSGSGSNSEGQTYQVEEDGSVALPVIGHVQVVGLTRMQAAKQIEDLYRKTLLKDPIIELKIVNLKVTVLGEIKSQGNYPLVKDKTTLVEMIGEAGGLTDRANEKNIKIIRGNQNNPQVTLIDLSDIKSLSNPATILQNGDIIYIAQNKRAVQSDKFQNFSTILQPALIILNTVLIVFTLARR